MSEEDSSEVENRANAPLACADDSSLDRALYLVTDRRRRALLYALRRQEGEAVDAAELARVLVYDLDGVEDEQRIRTDLHHQQLPRLSAAGVVDYDRESERVRYVGDDLLDDILDWTETRE